MMTRRQLRQRGFTLVEVLLAMIIVSLILVGAYSGLRTGTRAVDRGEQVVDLNNHLRIVSRFLRTQMMQMMPLQIPSDDAFEDNSVVFFEGDDRGMRFAGPMPGYLSNGGPHEQRIFIDRGELLFEHSVLNHEEEWRMGEPRDPVVLLSGIDRARFEYLAPPEGDEEEPVWVSDWETPSVLPMMIRLEIDMDPETRVVWPTMEVRPRIDAATAGRRLDRPFVLPTRGGS